MKKVKFSHILPMILFVISAIVFSVAAIAGGSADRAHADGGGAPVDTYTVSYDANGATGGELPTGQTEYAKGSSVTVSGNTGDFENTGLLFVGWNTASDGSGTWYDGGDTFEMGDDVTLYAQWSLFEGHGTEERPYLIKTSADWDALSEHINGGGTTYNGKHFKLTDDITITTVLGCRPGSVDNKDRPFVGYFDGDGHTLNADIEKSVFAAPFGVINDSVIENLTVTGTVRSANNHPAGLVAAAKGVATEQGSLTIRNVMVSADVICEATHVAGVIGHVHGTNVTMENVVFNGSMTVSMTTGSVQGGFIGWGGLNGGVKFNATLKDCMFDGTYRSGVSFYPVAYWVDQGNVVLENDFYSTKTWSGGNPVPETGDGKVRYVVATVEKDGATTYYENVSDAVYNWTDGSTLKLINDASISSITTINSGEKTLDLNGHGLIKTGAGRLFIVTGGATLNVIDSDPLPVHKFTVNNGLATVNDALTSGYQTFTGGYITGGYAKGETETGWGGCIILGMGGQSATVNIHGGTIIGNRCDMSGAAMRVNNYTTLNMTGGALIYNTAAKGGAITCESGAVLNVGGVVDNNYVGSREVNVLLEDKKLVISSELGDPTSVGVTLSNGKGVFTQGWSEYMGDKDPADYFTSDNGDYEVFLNKGGEAEIGFSHVHDGVTFNNKWNITTSLPTSAGNYYLACDVTISSTWIVPSGTTNLCLNGHSITRTGASDTTGSVIKVGGGATLNLYDCDTTTEHRFTVNDATPNGAGLAVVNDDLTGSEGTDYLTFTGGYITGGNANPYGGGVYIELRGKFEMFGGTIIGNTATSHGGGVCVSSANIGESGTQNFIMHGGEICYNKANWGGGIAIYGQTDITGHVSISNNVANSGGAGIELEKNGRLYMNCGIITDNVILAQNGGMWKGGGVHVPSGSEFHISGDLQIKDNYQDDGETNCNLFIRSGLSLTIDSALNQDALICVELQDGTGTFTSGWSTSMGDSDPADYFTSDIAGYTVIKDDKGEAQLAEKVVSVTVGETESFYGDLSSALAVWTDGSTLKLYNDVSVSSAITSSGIKTFDLNGKTLTFNGSRGSVFYVTGGKLTVKNGTVTGGNGNPQINGGGFYRGGGFAISDARVTLDRVAVTGNTSEYGGGLYIVGSSFVTLNDCVITDNTVADYGHQWGGCGGAVFIDGNSAVLVLNDTRVYGNYSTYATGNATDKFDGISVGGGELRVSGNTKVYDNLGASYNKIQKNILLGNAVTVSGELTDGANIGVTMQNGKGVFTQGWSEYMGDKDPADYFTSDNGNYEVFLNKGGEAEIGVSHVHDGVEFNKKWNITTSLPTAAGNYYLACDVTISSTWIVPYGTTNLCLNGHSITRTGASDKTGSVIKVGGGATLNLYDCGTEIRYYVVEDPSVNGAGLGTVVEKSVYDEADEIARGTFEGGYITGGVISGTADGDHLIGGGVNVDGGAFTMYGGTIIGNKVCINGGAVKVKGNGASFTMNGGALIANYNDCYGGAVSVGDNNASRLCNLTINGGIIARNKSGSNGGAIHIDGNGHNLIITGGSIVDNYTGGNYYSGEKFTPARSGGAVIADGGYVKISGEPVISGNMQGDDLINNIHLSYRYDRKFMELSGGLGDGADVGVYYKNLTSSSDIKVAFGAVKEDLKHLHFDIPEEGTLVFCDGEKDWFYLDGVLCEVLGTHHTHEEGTLWACAVPVALVVVGETVTYYYSFEAAMNAWTSGSVEATLRLLADVTTSSTVIVNNGEKTLDLNGHGIIKTGTGRVFTVINGATFNITDGNPQIEHKFTVSNGLATVNDDLTGSEGVDYLTFTGGYITGGYAQGETETGWGGCLVVSLGAKRATLNISGGTIIGNRCDMSGAAIRLGGDKNDYTVFNMTGGAIMYNTAGQGGAVTWEEAGVTVKISGGVIDNNFVGSNEVNVYILVGYGQKITVDSAFTDAASIGVKLSTGKGVFTSGWSDNMGDADPADYFYSQNADYSIFVNDDGELYLSHAWTYSVEGNVITATCGDGACSLSGQTLTINAQGKTYDGTDVEATLTPSAGWTAANDLPTLQISYSGNGDVGTYTAYVTIDGKTACAEFTITAKTITVTAEAKSKVYGEDDPALTYNVTGLVGEDETEGELSRIDGENVGAYAIDQGTVTAGDNYIIEYTGADLTIIPAESTLNDAPKTTILEYDGSDKPLVSGFVAEGGTVLYALGADGENAPTGDYLATVPTATETGNYYVWYMVEGDENHNDILPACVKVTLATDEWVTFGGKVYLSDGVTPLSGATVTLIKGNKTVDYVKTDADGKYDFTVPKGVYNVVTQNGDVTKTILVTLFDKTEKDVAMPGGKTESVLKVDDEDGYFGVAVGGLDEEAQAIREAAGVSDGTDVSLTMTVGRNADKTAASEVYEAAPDKALEFFEIKVEKTVGSETTVINQTANVLEIAVPYAKADKREIRVYSYHDNAVRTFTASTTKEDGTFCVDAENGIVYVYTKSFSTYAIAYTPYYDISGTVTLGDYSGTYQVTIQSLDGKKTFTFENVEIGAIDLKDIPMGQYVMTVTWTDGATNTITMPLDLGEEYAQGDEPATSEPKTSLLTEIAQVVDTGDTVGDITDGEIRLSACEGSLQPTTPPSEEESSPALPEAQTPDKVTFKKDEE